MKNKIIKISKKLKVYKLSKALKQKIKTYSPTYKRKVEDSIKFYSKFIKENDLIFDIGANEGEMTHLFSKLGAKVVAVEPTDEAFKKLNKRFAKNRKIKTLNSALGEKEGVAQIIKCEDTTLSTMSPEYLERFSTIENFSNLSWDKKQKIKVITLDKLIQEFGVPDFIKIDAEGFEYKVILGISSKIKVISFEFNTRLLDIFKKCIEKLEKLENYEYNYTTRENREFELPNWISAKKIIKEIFFVPEET